MPRSKSFCVLAAVAAMLVAPRAVPAQPQSQPLRGEATVTTAGGYGRIVIRTDAEVESQVRLSGNILVIQFRQPVAIQVDRLGAAASEYIGAARRDPDGRALRFAMAQKVKVSSMIAGDRLFVDLLPASWTGDAPPLPREVVEELARKANEAERLARRKLALAAQKAIPPVRVRVTMQPTFTRYIFELPELTGVTAERAKDQLTLVFAKPLRFDLSDAKLAQARSVSAVDALAADGDTAQVRFKLSQQADIRTFREDSNYVIDVSPIDVKPAAAKAAPLPGVIAPQAMPAKDAASSPAPAAAKPKSADSDTTPKPALAATPVQPPAAPAPVASRDPSRPVVTELRRQADSLRLFFPFAEATPAAVFQRADTLWLVFDSKAPVDVGALVNDPSKTIASATASREDGAQIVRIKLARPRLTSVEPQDSGWLVTIGDAMAGTTRPLTIARNIVGPGRTSMTIPFDNPHDTHWLADTEVGDKLLVVTGLGPARAILKAQDFVDLHALASAQGIAIAPIADDLTATLSVDKVLLARPGGLVLSDAAMPLQHKVARAVTFDTQAWNADRESDFPKRQLELVRAAAEAPFTGRTAARLDLARFYFARQMYAEAKAVLDTAIAEDHPTADAPAPLVLRAIASIMLGRPEDARRDLANPAVGNQNDAPLWRAVALARGGQWAQAHDAFRGVEDVIGALPLPLQRAVLANALRACVEVGDYAGAARRLNDFQVVGQSADVEATVSVLTGRMAEALGHTEDALAAYRAAESSNDQPAAAQARLREIALRSSMGEMKKADVITALENLTTLWRGDETEIEALQMLARLYTEQDRYRDAFHVMRVALTAFPNSPQTQSIRNDAAKTFDTLFLAGRGDKLPAIDALSLFYDFRELTPIGRRGDEMIRRLAERLVSVDLLDQAAELLQYQVDNRLQGAARAQVATRLAVIELMNRKPKQAQAVLRATRTAELSDEIRIPRLMIEARALSDIGRHDFALEVIAGIEGRESLRLRADIYWAARKWQKAAEHIELLYGDRWKSFEPLNDMERADLLRAGVAYSLAGDRIGMSRLKDKYAAKMAQGPDGRAFDVVTGGLGVNSPEFREVAKFVASGDTLTGFLHDLKTRYPEMAGVLPDDKPSSGASSKADPEPTGSIARKTPKRLSSN